MDVLEKITLLRKSRSWSVYQLAERSGLTQSTISSWYRKQMTPSIASLERICEAFDISLSQFFMEEDNHAVVLSSKERELLYATHTLSNEQFDTLLSFLRTLQKHN